MKDKISERAQLILKMVTERYIQDGHAVGSKILAEYGELNMSSATIRNIMADLEELGFLMSPHTSAGRIPTPLGYRFFVNSLLAVKPVNETLIEQHLHSNKDKQNLIQDTTELLSDMTQLISIISLPKTDGFVLRHIEFLKLSQKRLLVVLVLNEKEVQNRIIQVEREYSESELVQFGNYLTSHFTGITLGEIPKALLARLEQNRQELNDLLTLAVKVANEISVPAPKDYLLGGQENLLNIAEVEGIDRLRTLFQAFTEKQHLLNLFNKALSAEGVQIFIGEEVGTTAFQGCSFVTAPYAIDGQSVGVLGVIGPNRMPYDAVVPIVDITAKILSSMLKLEK